MYCPPLVTQSIRAAALVNRLTKMCTIGSRDKEPELIETQGSRIMGVGHDAMQCVYLTLVKTYQRRAKSDNVERRPSAIGTDEVLSLREPFLYSLEPTETCKAYSTPPGKEHPAKPK